MVSIPLHPQYGVNPTMSVCRWCDKETGEIALLGRRYDGEAPHRMALDDNPCDKCKAAMALGVTIIEMPNNANKSERPARIADRTGRWCVMTWEGFENFFNEETVAAARLTRAMLIEKDTADMMKLFDKDIPFHPTEGGAA